MALITKTGYTYKSKKLDAPSAYLVVDKFANNDKTQKTATFSWYIFAEKSARDTVNDVLDAGQLTVTGDDYTSHFSPAAITADDNEFKQAYIYMLALTDDDDNLVWGDNWKSDE